MFIYNIVNLLRNVLKGHVLLVFLPYQKNNLTHNSYY